MIGNAGSFFKNPIVTPEQCRDIIGRDPEIVHYPMADGSVKLAAGWLIDACGWKGKTVGQAGVYEKQALVLVNRGGADRLGEVMTLAGPSRRASTSASASGWSRSRWWSELAACWLMPAAPQLSVARRAAAAPRRSASKAGRSRL